MTGECGNCGCPIVFDENRQTFDHNGDPMIYGQCDQANADHLLIPTEQVYA